MIPEWFIKLFFYVLGIVLVCGAVFTIIIMIAIIKSAAEEMDLKRKIKTRKRND